MLAMELEKKKEDMQVTRSLSSQKEELLCTTTNVMSSATKYNTTVPFLTHLAQLKQMQPKQKRYTKDMK